MTEIAMDRRFPSSAAVLLLLSLTAVFTVTTLADSDNDNQCVYTVYVRTGTIIKGGTDARIGLSISDATGASLTVPDLTAWGGLGGPDHDYFERGALDVFSGRGPCGLEAPLCRLNLTSDGAGAHHGWFCDYVEVTATGPHAPCMQSLFYVRQWLAEDAAPFRLYAEVDGCGEVGVRGGKGHFVVGEAGAGDGAESSVFDG